MEMIKVLFVHGGTLEKAGTEAYMMSVFHHVDPKHIQLDFLVFGTEPGAYDQEVLEQGAKIFRIPMRPSEWVHNPHLSALKKAIQAEHYDIVHAHMNALNYPVLKFMKKLGIPILISHSHGSRHFVTNKAIIAYKEQIKAKIATVSDLNIACSQAAGDFLYGSAPYTLINNGIAVEDYRYNPHKRQALRKMWNLEDALVFGHVGRFNFQKNHQFLIATFKIIVDQQPQARLMLVGDGELREAISQQCEALGILDKVIFTGVRDDVADLMQAMDYFLLPSLFEGLPYVLVEAQATGLQCFAANTIDPQSKIIADFYFLGLDHPQTWADFILKHLDYERHDQSQAIKEAGFDAVENVHELTELYETLVRTKKNPASKQG